MTNAIESIYCFGEFTLEMREHRLRRLGQEVILRPKAFAILGYLVARHGHLIEKDELLRSAWDGTAVSETVLTHCITEIRQALQDNPREPRYLKTLPKVGYKFIGEVTEAGLAAPTIEMPARQEPLSPSIVVLPFANLNPDSEAEYLCDGLVEEIINSLTRLPGLRVVARTSSFFFRGKGVDVREIGARLNVQSILEGSVRMAGNRIRVTAQLVSAADGYHQWSERYDREMNDVFAIQDEICQAIVDKLRVELVSGFQLVKRHTENPEAFSMYLKARYQLNKFTAEGMAKGKEHLEQAISVDPSYALPHYGLAYFYWQLGFFGFMPPRAANAQAGQAILKALKLDEMLPQAHAMMAMLRACNFDWTGAECEFRRGLELDPKSEDVWREYDYFYLVPMRRLDEAVAASHRALELDPLSPFLHWRLGYRYYLARQWDRAIEQCRGALELDPTYAAAYAWLARSYIQKGEPEEALRIVETNVQSARFKPIPLTLGHIGYVYARAGRIGEATQVLQNLQDIARKTFVSPSSFALIYLGLGEIDNAFEWLQKAVEGRDGLILHFHVDPVFDLMRSDPRFLSLVQKMNLTP